MNFLTVASLLTICGLALAAPSYHQAEDHETKYVVVTKHELSSHPSWQAKESPAQGFEHSSYKIIATEHSALSDHYKNADEDKDAKYQFDYGVKNLKTGDIKNQWEHRDGDRVKGTYSLIEADGTTRLVEYSADDHSGFNAVVKKIGQATHPVLQAQPSHSQGHGYEGHDHATSYANVKHH